MSLLLSLSLALANERHFTYTYDAEVLPAGAREVESWTTFMPMSDGMLDVAQRVEIEFPVSPRVMSALYLNGSGGMHGSSFDGISSEWKWNVVSRHTAPVGLALYGEVGLGPVETELEAKVIIDKEAGPLLLAYNLVGEAELEREMSGAEVETEVEWVIENDLGVAVRLGQAWSVGAEVRNHTEIPASEGFEHSAFFVGPTVAYASADWWGALTALPQVYAIHDEPGLVMDEHTMVEARLLMGFHF
ncbi:MAG: hypothetical protein FJ102_01280 [Deltaproteobacteria bacterium]|nr:hypothetical protein [Deltaproteobacteria bacterium]